MSNWLNRGGFIKGNIIFWLVVILSSPFLINEILGRGPAWRCYQGIPGRPQADRIAKMVQDKYKQLTVDGQVTAKTGLQELIPYLGKVVHEENTDINFPVQLSSETAGECIDNTGKISCSDKSVGCIRLPKGAIIQYWSDENFSSYSGVQDNPFLRFVIDVDGKYGKQDAFSYLLHKNGELIAEAEIQLIALF